MHGKSRFLCKKLWIFLIIMREIFVFPIFAVPYPPVTVKPEYKPEIISMVSILGAVVLTCVITFIIFCVLRRRQNNSTKEHKGKTDSSGHAPLRKRHINVDATS